MRIITLSILFLLFVAAASAQQMTLDPKLFDSLNVNTSGEQIAPVSPTSKFVKEPGHYTKQQWRTLIDSFWGPGLPTADKLKMFDDYWNLVDQKWSGFPNLVINWDSLKNVYRPEVAAGVSRGRFAAILSRLTMALNETHVYIIDQAIDSTLGYYGKYPNYPSYQYLPGVPILNINAPLFRTCFGAGLTPLPDSTALVYSVIPNHPLGLQAGDIVLGYDGYPWMYLFNELLDIEFPIISGGSAFGSSAASSLNASISSVGMNWGLFDTIDIKKYGTDQILHYPTSLLSSLKSPYFIATEQLPVVGVSFPLLQNADMVSWGVISGTTIGYIYVLDWNSTNTRTLFTKAVDELMHTYKVDGLILDFRYNVGGTPNYANGGFSHLFNADHISNYSIATRNVGNDHNSFSIVPYNNFLLGSFSPTPEIFDHPIAVLTGPNCVSAGDYNAHRMRFHPMVRSFGLPTNGAYTALSSLTDYDIGTWYISYGYRIDHSSVFSNYNNEGFLIHKTIPVDEQVWFTRDGVAKGEDDVVKKAMEWINTVSYSRTFTYNKSVLTPNGDSLNVTAIVLNPLEHTLSVTAVLKQLNETTVDSIKLYNDGQHNDGAPNDSIWGGTFTPPDSESFYYSSVITNDLTAGTFRSLPIRQPIITSAGPIVCLGETSSVVPQWGKTVLFRFKLCNNGKQTTVANVRGVFRILDTSAIITAGFSVNPGDLAPGQQKLSSSIAVKFSSSQSGKRLVPMEIAFSSLSVSSIEYWRDTVFINVDNSTDVALNESVPLTFSLGQNFPNPFNPSTSIRYALPSSANVKLSIHDILGREIATLVNEEQSAGWKEVVWNAIGKSSGIYFYKLTAGNYVGVKKLMLLK
jgi:hypothetical protein